MKFFLTNRRPALRLIYRDWALHNVRYHAMNVLAIAAVVSTMLMAFDFIFFGKGALIYFPYRLGCSVAQIVLFFTLKSLKLPPQKLNLYISGAFGLVGLVIWNGLYIHFFLNGPENHHHVVVAAIYMNIYITQFFVQRFWRLQYICTLAYMAAIVAMALIHPETQLEVTSFALWNVSVFIICWVQRRAFCSGLFLRYEGLRKQFPTKMARVICTESPDYTVEEAFKPVLRPCACICLDWRSFQAYAASQPPAEVAQQIQAVHDIVITMLGETIADESYFADWTADEIFVTVYSESDDIEAILRNTWSFCSTFQQTIRTRLNTEVGAHIPIIDIGAAVGIALVGLVGPTSMKKTTIVGAVGGIAKRLESAAKQMRENSQRSAAPILCINKDIYDHVCATQPDFGALIRPLHTEVKDLKGQSLYVYSESLSEVVAKPLSEAG